MQTSEATQTEQNRGGQRVSGVLVLFHLLFEFSLQTTVDIFVHLSGADKPEGLPGLFQLFRTCEVIIFNTGFLNPVPLFICKKKKYFMIFLKV